MYVCIYNNSITEYRIYHIEYHTYIGTQPKCTKRGRAQPKNSNKSFLT